MMAATILNYQDPQYENDASSFRMTHHKDENTREVKRPKGYESLVSDKMAESLGVSVCLSRASAFIQDDSVKAYKPKTALGKKLFALRQAYIDAGGTLLDDAALDAEFRSRRGSAADG